MSTFRVPTFFSSFGSSPKIITESDIPFPLSFTYVFSRCGGSNRVDERAPTNAARRRADIGKASAASFFVDICFVGAVWFSVVSSVLIRLVFMTVFLLLSWLGSLAALALVAHLLTW